MTVVMMMPLLVTNLVPTKVTLVTFIWLDTSMATKTATVESLKRMVALSEPGYFIRTKGWPDAGGDVLSEPNLRHITEADMTKINIRAMQRGVSLDRLRTLALKTWNACDDERVARQIFCDIADGLEPDEEPNYRPSNGLEPEPA
jgi:hypothetical protein